MLIYVIQHIKLYTFECQHNRCVNVVEMLWWILVRVEFL